MEQKTESQQEQTSEMVRVPDAKVVFESMVQDGWSSFWFSGKFILCPVCEEDSWDVMDSDGPPETTIRICRNKHVFQCCKMIFFRPGRIVWDGEKVK